MASSNRHWPSMFRSKPSSTSQQHQWQLHDNINSSLISTASHKPPCTSVGGCEERSPEPKPRWNPRPEQIRILEAIFNSGMVNPPRDEIKKIRTKLQEYGQVGDANVFYWFQNRKSRSKHKLQRSRSTQPHSNSSSSSSSEKSKSSSNSIDNNSKSTLNFSLGAADMLVNSPNTNTTYVAEPFFFSVQQTPPTTQGFCPHDVSSAATLVSDHVPNTSSALYLTDLMGTPSKNYTTTPPLTATHTVFPLTTPTTPSITHIQGCEMKATIFINEVAFDVPSGPFNVSEVFGEDALLIHSSGHPLVTNELQHGAVYFLVRMPTPPHHNLLFI